MPVKSFPLPLPDSLTPPDFINKAGVLPLSKNVQGEWQVLLMQPVSSGQHSTPPGFQLCKGTRMQQLPDGAWVDVKDGTLPHEEATLESMLQTATREVEEEAGMQFSPRQTFFDMGPVAFISASTGQAKWMHLFAAVVDGEQVMNSQDLTAAGTQDVRWIPLREAVAPLVRQDHADIIAQVYSQLAEHLGQNEHSSTMPDSSRFQR